MSLVRASSGNIFSLPDILMHVNVGHKQHARPTELIVQDDKLAGVGAHSYCSGNATGGSEEAAKFKNHKTTKHKNHLNQSAVETP